MDKLQQSVNNFLSLEDHITDGSSQLFHKVVSSMHDLCFHILEAEKNGMSSVFVKRLQDWPRKYPGDFETIEYICNLENKSQYGKVEYYIEEYALNSAMAQQHRNKIERQSEIILNALLNGSTAQKILSVGCGGCRDIMKISKNIANIYFDLVLHDIDREALELSKKRLAHLRGRAFIVSGNFLQSLRKIEKRGPFDLILAGGLFDYISDKHISFFLKRALSNFLNKNGTLFFTNIKKENPYQVWQEYLADWKLVYRNEDEIRSLLTGAGFPNESITVEKDATGLTLLVSVKHQIISQETLITEELARDQAKLTRHTSAG
jgi:ubiquinone/menaquinone biosynthesis C-methylase UbiE